VCEHTIHRLLIRLWAWLALPDWLQWKILSLWTPKFRVAVAAIVLDEQSRVLLCEHTYRGEYPWGLPGGNIQLRENPDQAIQRETFEETGLSVRILRPLFVRRHPDRPQFSIIYLCTPTGGSYQPNAEVRAIRFFDPTDLPDQLIPTEREMIADAYRIITEKESSDGVIGKGAT
jgi:ADP-ribose pyrophosphatase YjhB (NUDIX family)